MDSKSDDLTRMNHINSIWTSVVLFEFQILIMTQLFFVKVSATLK